MLASIKQVLQDNFLAADQAVLREVNHDGVAAFTMEASIDNKEQVPYALYRFENPSVLFPYFKSGQDLRKMCDFILFAERGNTFWCLLIELKRGKESADKQLAAGEAFARFIIDAAERVQKPIACATTNFRRVRVEEFKNSHGSQKAVTPQHQGGFINLKTQKFSLKYLLR